HAQSALQAVECFAAQHRAAIVDEVEYQRLLAEIIAQPHVAAQVVGKHEVGRNLLVQVLLNAHVLQSRRTHVGWRRHNAVAHALAPGGSAEERQTEKAHHHRVHELPCVAHCKHPSLARRLPGHDVYIVAEGDLTGSEQNTHHEEAQPEQPNIYLIQGTTPRFIATLSHEDSRIKGFGQGQLERSSPWVANLGERIAEVTPNGQSLTFESRRNLTGYPESAASPFSVELYDYSATHGQLVCVSCMPDGGPRLTPESEADAISRVPVSAESETYTAHWMSENGNRIFFQTRQSLVPQDTNSTNG